MILKHLPTEDVRDERELLTIMGVKKPGGLGPLLLCNPECNMIEVEFIKHVIAFTAKYPNIEFEVQLAVKDKHCSIVTRYANQQK